MLRSFVVTFTIAVLLAISHSIADAQYHYRVEHSWEPRYKGIPSILMDVARTRLAMQHMEKIERIKASNRKARSQNVHVHITPPANTRQSPSWTEYQEMANSLRETQRALVNLQAEIANLKTRSSGKTVTKKVVPKKRQSSTNRKAKLATRKSQPRESSLTSVLLNLEFPSDIIYDIVEAKQSAIDNGRIKGNAWVVYQTLFTNKNVPYGKRLALWKSYTARK